MLTKFLSVIFLFFISLHTNSGELAFITNQESNKLDIIDISNEKKISEIVVGMSPAAVFVDSESKRVFVSNPESNNVSVINLQNNSNVLINSIDSPMGLVLEKKKTDYM